MSLEPTSTTATGLRSLLQKLLEYRMPVGVGWAHVLGSLLLGVFVTQLITGILLATVYSPSANEAWESIRYIEENVRAGSVIRGIHHWASSLFIVLLLAHMARTFLWGAHKGKRKWTWIVGVLLLVCGFGLGFTGYLLPWDLKAWFGTRVGLEIMSSPPGIGPLLMRLLAGGPSVGALTLPRFYTLHVIVFPLAVLALVALHFVLIRVHGITPRWNQTKLGKESFYPHQIARDSAALFFVIAALVGVAIWKGAALEGRADPLDTSWVPRPEWYFLGFQQLLRVFQGRWELLGSFVLPTAALVILGLLPWLDRGTSTNPAKRRLSLSIGAVGLVLFVGLTFWGAASVRQEERALAQRLSTQPAASSLIPPVASTSSSTASGNPELVALGARLYIEMDCARCHEQTSAGTGTNIPPRLDWAGGRARFDWLVAYLKEPTPIRFVSEGRRPLARMPDFRLTDTEAMAVASYLMTMQDSSLTLEPITTDMSRVAEGEQLFQDYQCLGCHRLGDDGNEVGPHLDTIGQRLQPQYMRALILDPQGVIPGTAMKNLQLWEEEAEAIVQYLMTLK